MIHRCLSIVVLLCLLSVVYSYRSFTFQIKSKHDNKRNLVYRMSQVNVNMPALSSTMKEGRIVSWNKNIGDKVSSGDILLVVESDKADMDVESFEEGYLAAIHVPEGEIAPVGQAVATIVDTADAVATYSPSSSSAIAIPTDVTDTSAVIQIESSQGNDPSYSEIAMPALSSTMKEGKIVAWSKNIGDKVSSGDVVLVVESDKADMDVESYEDGYLAHIVVNNGGVAPVGAPVAYLADSAAEVDDVKNYVIKMSPTQSKFSPSTAAKPQIQSVSLPSETTSAAAVAISSLSVSKRGRVSASGYARKLAREKGIDLEIVGSIRSDGYITAKDLDGVGATLAPVHLWIPTPGSINASPTARKLAKENGLDIAKLKGTGNFGRVMPDDVLLAAGKKVQPKPSKPASLNVAVSAGASTTMAKETSVSNEKVLDGIVPMTGMQKAVAKNMEATLGVPIFRVSREITTDAFDELYGKLKPKGITVSAMLAKAVAMTLIKYPIMNAAYVDSGIKYNKNINIAMAVAIDGGLITPTIIEASDKNLFDIGAIWKELVGKAKSKTLSPAEYSSGTFTITNLGMFGVSQFDAILPQGTGAILSIAASTPKVVLQSNGYYGVKKSMIVTLTCDHRHIYGADAAEFLRDLGILLEEDVKTLLIE